MTRFFYDTEFLEDGKTIELISIGIVTDGGREYYAVNSDMPVERIKQRPWLCKHVVPSLPVWNAPADGEFYRPGYPPIWSIKTSDVSVKPRWVIANEVREFLLAGDGCELWADYAAYDHVVLCQLWGTMMQLPDGIPMFTNDFQQLMRKRVVNAPEAPESLGAEHNALADARRLRWQYMQISGGDQ